jgi:hypothetical protein
MATFQVTVPDTLVLGRNGAIGSLPIEWDRVPQPVKDHIATVYFGQYLSDAANAGGKDQSSADRLSRAEKKLETMYAGQVRARGESATEPADPAEAEAFRMAKAALLAFAKATPEWSTIPKGERKKDSAALRVLDMRAAARGEPEHGDWQHYIVHYLGTKPEVRKEAERLVRMREGW